MTIESKEKINKKEEDLFNKMAEAGVHFGHHKSRTDPRMKPYISTVKGSISIIDLVLTAKKLEEALSFIVETVKNGGKILFVGILPQIAEITKKIAQECGMPYVVGRWLGGTLTNFLTIRKRIGYLLDLEKKKKSGELEKYTKREQMLFKEEIDKLNKKLGGIKELIALPDAVLVLSIKHSQAAVKEAVKKKVKIIGLTDTDSDPSLVDYPIPSNDDAIPALEFMLEQFKETIIKNKK